MPYYCKQISPEIQESPLIRGDYDEVYDDITITGNNRYTSRLSKDFKDIREKIESFLDDKNATPGAAEFMNCLTSHFPKANNEAYTDDEKQAWFKLISRYKPDIRSELSITADMLTLTHPGSKYVVRSITGSCQSDWNYMLYNSAKYDENIINTIATEYFNEGSEWIIHDDLGLDEITDPDDIDGYSIYCHDSDPEHAVKEIAEILGTNPDNIIAWSFDGYTKIPRYKKI